LSYHPVRSIDKADSLNGVDFAVVAARGAVPLRCLLGNPITYVARSIATAYVMLLVHPNAGL
jgi:hypothetical protein